MKTYNELSEDIGVELIKHMLPKKILHYLKRTLHRDQYFLALKVYKKIMQDKTDKVPKEVALVKAAQVVGLNPRELMKILNKETRYA